MTPSETFMWIGIALGAVAIVGIFIHIWAACAMAGRHDKYQE